jgi:predicted Zn-dependent protease
MKSLPCLSRFAPALLASLLLAWGARADDPYKLPDFGSSADTVMTGAQERQLGKAFMRSVRKALPVLDDPLLTDYLEDLGERLVASSEVSGGNFTSFSSTNRWSTPLRDPTVRSGSSPVW